MPKKKVTNKLGQVLPPTLEQDLKLERMANRAERARHLTSSRGSVAVPAGSVPGMRSPVILGLGDRMFGRLAWRPMQDRRVSPGHVTDAAKVVDPDAAKGKVDRAADYIGSYYGYTGILRPEYDLQEPFALVDTEAFLKQAINRKISLMFRTGFEVVSEQNRHKEYIEKRFSTMEYVTGRSMEELFKAIMYNLSLCSNCIVLKIRDVEAAGVSRREDAKHDPVAGYSIIPAHTIFPWLEKGVIKKWRRFYDSGMPYEDIAVHNIIHFKWDVKPGHIWGTPRTVAVRDDIFALRRLEENLELLFINHLFPMFHVKVGTETEPCEYLDNGTSEIDYVRHQIENMPKEGVFVTDERVEVDAVGAEGETLEFRHLLGHLKNRVYTGLSMSAVDMGEGDTANRATADNISQVLKDSIKSDQGTFGQQVRMHMFKELFLESSQSLSVQGATAETRLEWHEVDTDGKIKEENHALNLYNSHLIDNDEARKRMKLKPLDKDGDKKTHYEKQVKDLETHISKLASQENDRQHERQMEQNEQQAKLQEQVANVQIALLTAQGELAKIKATAQTRVLKAKTAAAAAGVGVGGGKKASAKKTTPTKKSAQNKSTPTNQHGRNTGPTKAKSSLEKFGHRLYDRVVSAHELWDGEDKQEWDRLATVAVDGLVQEVLAEIGGEGENSYTRQVRTESDRLKALILDNPDPELLYVLLTEQQDEEDTDDVEEDSTGAGDTEPKPGLSDDEPGEDSDDDWDSDPVWDEAGNPGSPGSTGG